MEWNPGTDRQVADWKRLTMSDDKMNTLSYEVLANALFENYESIYDIDLETDAYNVYYESDSYRKLDLTRSGTDFFTVLPREVAKVIDPEDRDYVLGMLSKDALVSGVTGNKYYSIVYRINRGGRRIYHQLRATLQPIGDKDYILMGVRDIDALMRQRIAHEEELASKQQKADNYLEAVLATALAYIGVNLTRDRVLERSPDRSGGPGYHVRPIPTADELPSYTALRTWVCENLVCEGRERYLRASDRDYLLRCFEQGEGRVSVSFAIATEEGDHVPCREVFYLYREHATGDVHVLCVIYDLTQQQRQEKEFEELRQELVMSRVRNSASQMKPHFLYNALGSIQEVILEDPERAAALLEDFTIHLRSCIKAMDSDQPIPFEQELENIKAYAHIENMRFGDKLDVRFELGETDFLVLPLSIQPLVENAIRHGVYQRGPEGGSVILRSWAEGDAWVVQVEDTGVGFDVHRYAERVRLGDVDSTGLKNIRFRLERILGAALDIESQVGGGTTATVRIPRKEASDEGDHSR